MQLQSFDHWTGNEIYACVGRPKRHPVRRIDGRLKDTSAPEYTIDPCDIIALERKFFSNRVLLIDLGAAFYHCENLDQIFTPASHAAPEILFGGDLTYQVDKWAFGCLLYEPCAHHTLVKLLFGWNNDAMKDQVAMLGKPPEHLWEKWHSRARYFHPDGTPKEAENRRLKVEPLSLEQRVRNLGKPLSERGYATQSDVPLTADLRMLHNLLVGLITYDPNARLSFDQIVAHPFFSGVEVPEF
nr:serine/threonine-protein kinase afc3 [Quercus suber]